MVTNVPLSGTTVQERRDGKRLPASRPAETLHGHYSYGVDGDYFTAMGFTLLEGRFLEPGDSRRRIGSALSTRTLRA